MWSAAACRRFAISRGFADSMRRALQEKAVASYRTPYRSRRTVLLLNTKRWCVSSGVTATTGGGLKTDRRYEPFAETPPLALLHPHSGFSRDHRNRALLRILRLHFQDLDLRFSVAQGSND